MSLQQVFSIVLFVISLAGILGSCSLKLFRDFHIGPGFLPLFYSLVLLILAVVYFLRGRTEAKADIKILFQKPVSAGTAFFLLFLASLILMILVGTYPALAFLLLTGLGYQKKMKMGKVILFSVVFLAFIYVIFTLLLKIPLEQGILLR